MSNTKLKEFLLKYLNITVGCILYAVAVSFFLDPNGIVPGGFTGLAMILCRFIPLTTGTMTIILNLPLIAVAIWKFGGKFLSSSIYAVVASSVFIDLLALIGPLSNDMLLSALVGGLLMAIGLVFVLKEGGTTGGTDIVVKLLRLKFRSLSAGTLFTFTDGAIVALSAVVFKNVEVALYAAICIIVYSKVIDLILYGSDEAKMLMIISDKRDEIVKRLLTEIDAGATIFEATGAYSGQPKPVVMCVVKKQNAPKALKIVKHEDPEAFTIISTANEVFGEGYKNHDDKSL